jgi:hypothetical protein
MIRDTQVAKETVDLIRHLLRLADDSPSADESEYKFLVAIYAVLLLYFLETKGD